MTTDWMKKETSEWFIKQQLTLKLTKTQPGEMYRNTKKKAYTSNMRGVQ